MKSKGKYQFLFCALTMSYCQLVPIRKTGLSAKIQKTKWIDRYEDSGVKKMIQLEIVDEFQLQTAWNLNSNHSLATIEIVVCGKIY